MSLTFEMSSDLLLYTVHGDVDYEVGLRVLIAGLSEVSETQTGTPTPVLFDIRDSAGARGAEELRGIATVVAACLRLSSKSTAFTYRSSSPFPSRKPG